MAKMHGPAFDDSGEIVEREVPDADVTAYLNAGYAHGPKPEAVKDEAKPEAESKVDKKK